MPVYGSGLYGSGLYGIGSSVTTLTLTIAGTTYPILNDGSFKLSLKIDETSELDVTILDVNSAWLFQKGQQVTLTDTLQGTLFTGFVNTSQITKAPGTSLVRYHQLVCINNHFLADKRTSNRVYNNQYAGVIVAGMINDILSTDGVTANYAVREDNTQIEFGQGTLNGTAATGNLGGDLELALAGSQVNIIESTTSNFGTGTLNNTTNSSNTLLPVATNAIKIQGTESITNDANAYTYVQIYTSGSISIISGRYLAYDIWIDSSSPSGQIGVDLVCTDGTTLRDNSVYNDSHNLKPHPNTDISGYAYDQWYHRKFLLDNISGKTISYITVAIEGDKPGIYTGYIKNILYVDVNDNTINTFYSGSLNVNPPKQLYNNGYSVTSCTSVPTYDCTSQTTNRVSGSYSVSNVNLLQSSFISWKTTLPTNTGFTLEYSLDGGNSYITCTNNAALPSLPAGTSLSGKSIQFRESFQQLTGASPEQPPVLNSVQLILNPTYTATKSDVVLNASTTSQWNAGTLSNTLASNNILSLNGVVRNWHGANLASITVFGDGATGPGPTTVHQLVNYDDYWLVVGNSMQGNARFDFAGTWQNAIMEGDIYVDVSTGLTGFVYRTTGWSNYDADDAYYVQIGPTVVTLQRGSNTSAASNGTRTQVATASVTVTGTTFHHFKVQFNGSTHTLWMDDVQLYSATDSTYTAAGNVGFRTSNQNAGAGYQGQLNNFGIVSALSGTWFSPSQSLSAAGTYGGSVVTWEDVSIGSQSTNLLVQSSVDGGSTFQTLTNGGSIPNLTLGQSLSGISLQLKVTLSTSSASCMPQIQYLVARVLGAFSSSGTRIAPAFDLSPALVAGSTLVGWNATTPNNTSVAVATSLDGSSYTNIVNGNGIAGINAQPLATLDTFSTNLAPNYTNTARTGGTAGGWLWDTLNSRLTVSGGTNALLLYTSISCKDLDMIIDLDQADCVGLAWRVQDVSDFYELDLFDASSSAGSTNAAKLYKVVANVKTQLGSTVAISFVRGTPYRARVKMVGTALTIWFDGSQIFSLTDSSLAGPGQVGLSEVSGIGRFYNFRVQPQGDNLSGKKVYSKVTLTSTDPTATPQLTDLTVAALNPNIALGNLIATATYEDTFVSANFDDLAKKSNTYWLIDPFLNMIFSQYQSIPAPWILTDKDILVDGLQVTNNGDLYRNRQTLTGVVATGTNSETKVGDGTTRSWTLGGILVAAPTIYLNGQLQTVGVKGIDTGKNFYWTLNSAVIDQDTSGALLQQTDVLSFPNYTYQYITGITIDNTNLANTITQKQFAALMGRTTATQIVLNQASTAQTVSGDDGDLTVSACRQINVDVNITAITGTSPTIQFFVDRKDINGIYYNLWSSSVINATGQVSTSIGAFALINQAFGSTVKFRWIITGTSPSVTFSASILGRLTVQSAGLGIVEAVEDVSSQALNISSATTYATSLLQRNGVIGNEIQFKTLRTGLAIGQYLPIFNPETSLNDATFLVTAIDMSQQTILDVSSGQPTQLYTSQVTAESGPNMGSWSKLLSSVFP